MERRPTPTPGEAQEQQNNFHEVAKQRKELRNAVRNLTDPEEGDVKSKLEKRELSSRLKSFDNRAGDFKIENYGGLRGAKEALRASQTKAEQVLLPVDLEAIYAQFPEYRKIEEDEAYLALLKDKRMKQIFALARAKTRGEKTGHEMHLKDTRNMIADTERELKQFPKIDLHAAELVQYKQNLAESGHIAMVPSTEKNLEAIGDKMLSNKNLFLFGLTGTGKTTLAEYATKHYTGKDPQMVYCSPQTKESNIWGHTGIVQEHGVPVTQFVYGPLAKAAKEGTAIIFDEFTNLPDEQISFLKGVFSKKVGDTMSIPGNSDTIVAEGFQMIFTANLKSEKNPNKKALPAEMADEFTQNNLEITYTPKEEAYDIMIARLLNRDASLDLSDYDLTTTLPNLCRAMADIQESYVRGTDKDFARSIGALESNGRAHSFDKFVTTQRSVEAIMSLWEVEKQKGDRQVAFAEFLDERLLTALNFKEFPEKDRILAAKIFASRGFLITVNPDQLHVANAEDVFALNAVKAMRGEEAAEELRKKSGKVIRHSLKEVAQLDPFERRAKAIVAEGEDLLSGEGKPKDKFLSDLKRRLDKTFGKENPVDAEKLTQTNEQFMTDTFTSWYQADASKAKQEAVLTPPDSQDFKALSQEPKKEAEFGKYTLNPETQGLDFEQLTTFVPDLSQFEAQQGNPNKPAAPLHEVMKYVLDTYGDKYYIPGIEYWKWLYENPDKIPLNLKDGNYYFFPGSVLRGHDGDWYVPYAIWSGSTWYRDAIWLTNDWFSIYRVVLLER